METNDETPRIPKRVHGLQGLFYQLEVLRELRAEMPIQTAATFLVIAMRPGMLQRHLHGMLGMSQSSASRNISALSKRDRHGKPGLGLIVQTPAPDGSKSPALHLTTLGYETVKRLVGTAKSHVP